MQPNAQPPGIRLEIEAVSLAYAGVRVVDHVDLAIEPGELVSLLGPSGCGKTTLLRAIAGFIRPVAGHIRFSGQVVDALPPGRRKVGIVFQNYALFPHMSVAENVAYGLHAQRVPKPDITPRVARALDAVQMAGFAERRPRQLSGGQQQRVSLARAIVTEPSVLLLDEPFAALDRALRLDLQLEIRRLQRRLGLTTVLVTHDQDEAMSMSDRMAVMRAGRLEQVGAPAAVYDAPASRFVASFVGSSVELPGKVWSAEASGCWVDLESGARILVQGLAAQTGAGVIVSARPEHLRLFDSPAPDRIPATLRQSAPIAGTVVHDINAGPIELKVVEARAEAWRPPGPVHVGLAPSARLSLFPLPNSPPQGAIP